MKPLFLYHNSSNPHVERINTQAITDKSYPTKVQSSPNMDLIVIHSIAISHLWRHYNFRGSFIEGDLPRVEYKILPNTPTPYYSNS